MISCCAYPCLKVFWVGEDSGWSQDWFTEAQNGHCHHIWKWAWKLHLPCVCSPSVAHHDVCVKLEKSRTKKKKLFFFSLLFPAFCLAWWDVGLISTKCWVRSVLVLCWQGCHVLPFCSDTLPTNHVCPLKFEVSTASHSVSPSSPSVICCVTMPKPLQLPGIVGQTAGRNVSFCSPCYRVLLQRSYFLCSCCAKGVWVLRDADIPEGFAQTHLSSSRFLLGLSNSYQNQEA